MRISRKQSLVIAVSMLVLFFALGVLFLPTQGNQQATRRQDPPVTTSTPIASITSAPTNAEESRFTLKDFHRSETKDGHKSWEIFGSQAQYFPQENAVKISAPKVWLYKKNGDVVHITAEDGKVHLLGNAIGKAHLEKNVVVVLNDKTSLESSVLNYDKATSQIDAPGPVHIIGEILDIRGDDLDGNVDTKEFHLRRNVSSILKPRGGVSEKKS